MFPDVIFQISESCVSVLVFEAEILRLRFGIGLDSPLTLEEIGQEFNVTRERIRQIDKKNPSPQKPDIVSKDVARRRLAMQIESKKPSPMPRFGSKTMLTAGDVARLLGIHVNTVRRWEAKGILTAYRVEPSGYRWFSRNSIKEFQKTVSTARSTKV